MFLLFIAVLIVSIKSELTVDQYVRKLAERIENATTYKLNVDNGEFFENLDASVIRDYGTFDFIVVGSGSTGGVLSSRLAEATNCSILLIEAGGEEDEITDIPLHIQITQFTDKNWGYLSTPQKTCCQGMVDKRCMQPRGKVIGGSTVLNALMYVRGHRTDFDNWEKMGFKGWSYEDVLPYFKMQENAEFPNGEPAYHGHGGLLNVAYSEPVHPLVNIFNEGNKELGLKEVDCNGANMVGVARIQSNIKHGRRHSTGRAYIDKFRNYRNFNVTTKALVTKILIKRSSRGKNKAEGVLFVRGGQMFKAMAKNAVIISAGAINTPQLLMLSGIGPKHQLSKHRIRTIVDLPVGEKLIDHPTVLTLTFRTNLPPSNYTDEELMKQYLHGKGRYTRGGGASSLAFLDLDESTKGRPEIELMLLPPPSVNYPITVRQFNLDRELAEGYVAKTNNKTDFTIFVELLHPESRGSVTLKSDDPKDFPNIDFNYFSDKNDKDIATLYKGIQYAFKLVETNSFKKIDTTWIKLPICEEHKENSKQYWYCIIRNVAATIYHPASTAPMGPVVNHKLLVHSFNNLYVADASVLPTSMSGHLSAPCMMIGEKLSAEIIQRFN